MEFTRIEGQRREDSINLVYRANQVVQMTCTMALGYWKHITTSFSSTK